MSSTLTTVQVEFLRPVTVSILSERRALAPFGLNGGHPGARGINLLVRKRGIVNLGSKSSVTVEAGDRLRLLTPGSNSDPMKSRLVGKMR